MNLFEGGLRGGLSKKAEAGKLFPFRLEIPSDVSETLEKWGVRIEYAERHPDDPRWLLIVPEAVNQGTHEEDSVTSAGVESEPVTSVEYIGDKNTVRIDMKSYENDERTDVLISRIDCDDTMNEARRGIRLSRISGRPPTFISIEGE